MLWIDDMASIHPSIHPINLKKKEIKRKRKPYPQPNHPNPNSIAVAPSPPDPIAIVHRPLPPVTTPRRILLGGHRGALRPAPPSASRASPFLFLRRLRRAPRPRLPRCHELASRRGQPLLPVRGNPFPLISYPS